MRFNIDTTITFLKAIDLDKMHRFYHDFLDLPLAMDQGICRIYETPYGNVGFCSHYKEEGAAGLLCFVMDCRESVDEIYQLMTKNAETLEIQIESEPKQKSEFAIYQFYARDPSGNLIEFQCFE